MSPKLYTTPFRGWSTKHLNLICSYTGVCWNTMLL